MPNLNDAALAFYLGTSGAGASAATPLNVRTPMGTGTDRSKTLTTTSSALIPANATRYKFFIKNDSAVDIWINFGGTAAATPGTSNMKIAIGGYYELTGYTGAINAIAASATADVTAREI